MGIFSFFVSYHPLMNLPLHSAKFEAKAEICVPDGVVNIFISSHYSTSSFHPICYAWYFWIFSFSKKLNLLQGILPLEKKHNFKKSSDHQCSSRWSGQGQPLPSATHYK